MDSLINDYDLNAIFLAGSGHRASELPGSIHEGKELGYSVSHAFGAAFDIPDLIVTVAIDQKSEVSGSHRLSLHQVTLKPSGFVSPVNGH